MTEWQIISARERSVESIARVQSSSDLPQSITISLLLYHRTVVAPSDVSHLLSRLISCFSSFIAHKHTIYNTRRAMSNLRMSLGKRLKSFRDSMGAAPDCLLSDSRSEISFTSFPIDPCTKAPLRPSLSREMTCSSSWKLLVALNQSDDEPDRVDGNKLLDFVRRSLQNDRVVEDPLHDSIPVLNKCEDVLPSSPAPSIQAGTSALAEKDDSFSKQDNAMPRRSRRLSHRVSFTALSNRCFWFKSNNDGQDGSRKRKYSRMQTSSEDTDEE